MKQAKTVLIVDDDRDFVRAITELLGSSGYQVKTAVNGREGLELEKKIQQDLILLDVMMTERTEGFFILQEIRRSPSIKNTPVIVISSIYTEHPGFKVDPDSDWLPADLFLAKPVEPERLLDETDRLISSSASSKTPLSLRPNRGER